MILKDGHSKQYLEDWQDGKIEQGLGIGCEFIDQYVRWKQGQVNFILGLDNVGKTHLALWYFLCLAVHHEKKFAITTLENKPGQSVKKLIEMKAQCKIENMSRSDLYYHHDWVDHYFKFLDHSLSYKFENLLDIYSGMDVDGCFTDPFTGLDRIIDHKNNYDFLNKSRVFANSTNKTLITSLHPRTEGGTQKFAKGHDMEGYLQPPLKAHSEGGQSFANRADDFWVFHRHTQHPNRYLTSEWHVAKVKDTDTGGKVTFNGEPVFLDYNFGLGFTMSGNDPLRTKKQDNLNPNINF